MAAKLDTEWREIIKIRMCFWVQRISGKPITSKQSKQIDDIVDQVMETRRLKNKKSNG